MPIKPTPEMLDVSGLTTATVSSVGVVGVVATVIWAVIVVLFTKVGSAMVTPASAGTGVMVKTAPSSKPVPLIVTVCVDGLTRGIPSSLGVIPVIDTTVGAPFTV